MEMDSLPVQPASQVCSVSLDSDPTPQPRKAAASVAASSSLVAAVSSGVGRHEGRFPGAVIVFRGLNALPIVEYFDISSYFLFSSMTSNVFLNVLIRVYIFPLHLDEPV